MIRVELSRDRDSSLSCPIAGRWKGSMCSRERTGVHGEGAQAAQGTGGDGEAVRGAEGRHSGSGSEARAGQVWMILF